MGKFKNIEVKPEILASLQAAVNSTADVVFGWTKVQLPINGACKVVSLSIINRDHAAAKPADFAGEIFFSKSDTYSMGAPNSTASIKNNHDIFAHTTFAEANFDAGLDLFSVATVDPDALVGVVLEPTSGADYVYISMTTKTNNEPDLRSALTVDGAVDSGTALTVADVDATLVLAPGDVLHAEDDAVIGTVKTINSATSVTLESAISVAIANNDVIHILSPITLIIGVEYN